MKCVVVMCVFGVAVFKQMSRRISLSDVTTLWRPGQAAPPKAPKQPRKRPNRKPTEAQQRAQLRKDIKAQERALYLARDAIRQSDITSGISSLRQRHLGQAPTNPLLTARQLDTAVGMELVKLSGLQSRLADLSPRPPAPVDSWGWPQLL